MTGERTGGRHIAEPTPKSRLAEVIAKTLAERNSKAGKGIPIRLGRHGRA